MNVMKIHLKSVCIKSSRGSVHVLLTYFQYNDNNYHDYNIIDSVHVPLTYLLPVGFLQLGKKGCHKPEKC